MWMSKKRKWKPKLLNQKINQRLLQKLKTHIFNLQLNEKQLRKHLQKVSKRKAN